MAKDILVVGDVPADVREAVVGVVKGLERAFNENDAAALGEQYSEDASWTNALGRRLDGRAEIAGFAAPALESFLKDSRARYDVVKLLAVAPEVVAVNVEQTPVDAAGDPIDDKHGRALYVIARRPDGWKIVAGQNNAIDAPTS